MSTPIYVYDVRTQLTEPVFVAYSDDVLNVCLRSLYGEAQPEFLLITKKRLHKTGANERYLDLPEKKTVSKWR